MKRIIITGANGAGKSHLAARLAALRPEVPLVSFDAIKLHTGWQQRPRPETEATLAAELARDAWILEGGPSLLAQAIGRTDALIWLDPPDYVRAWRLATRPLKNIGRTRPEVPEGNVDWPLQQYRFALRSLRNGRRFRSYISEVFEAANAIEKWRCRTETDLSPAIARWTASAD